MTMTDKADAPATGPTPSRSSTAYTILFALIVVMAVLTWLIPASEYDRVASEALGKYVPVLGTYHVVEAAPQTIFKVIMTPIAGFNYPSSYEANAIDVSLFVLIVGGFLGVVTATGAIATGVAQVMRKMAGREK